MTRILRISVALMVYEFTIHETSFEVRSWKEPVPFMNPGDMGWMRTMVRQWNKTTKRYKWNKRTETLYVKVWSRFMYCEYEIEFKESRTKEWFEEIFGQFFERKVHVLDMRDQEIGVG